MFSRNVLRAFLIGFVLCALAAAVARAQTTPTVKKEVAPRTSASSGVEMFSAYCAACHGPSGKGNGPAAPALKTTPADLSQLAKKNGGTFPTNHVEQVLRVGLPLTSHGSSDMPTWGDTFRVMGDEGTVRLRIANLISHLQTLQVK
jgi:mono/diheme cytochrome c family protein